MRRFLLLLLLLVMVSLLTACPSTKTTYYHEDPANPTRVTRAVEEDGDFFESKNLANHYAAIEHQTQSLIDLHQGNPYQTKTEQVLGGIVTAILVERVSLAPAPRTMTDVFDRNLTSWLSLGLEAYRTIDGDTGKRSASPNLEIKGTGNNLIFDSELGTGDASAAQFWLGDYQQLDLNVSGEGTSGSLDASRPYTYDYDWTRTETRTDSPSKEDSGIF